MDHLGVPPPRTGGFPGFGRVRRLLVVFGIVALTVGVVAALGPVREGREFRRTVECEHSVGGCFGRERATVVGRRTKTTTTTHTDAQGISTTTTQTHYKITWERADLSRRERAVPSRFYDTVREGQLVDLRTWHGEVVGVESAGGQHWFLPAAGVALVLDLYLAWLGLGVLLWALFFGWWDGWLPLVFRLFAWFIIASHPANVAADALVYGFDRGEIGWLIYLPALGAVALAVLLNRSFVELARGRPW